MKTLEAAKAMKLSAKDLLELRIIDEIINEPLGGAHRDRDLTLDNVRSSILDNLYSFSSMSREEILNDRKNKFLSIGRSRGFINRPTNSNNLSINENFIDKIKNKILEKKKVLLGIVLLLLISSLYFL